MRAGNAFGPGDIRIVTLPEPIPGEGQVLLRMRASGICGSDKWWWHVPAATQYIAGHEVAGEVVGLGPGVARLRVGDRVAVNNVVRCGTCPACRHGDFVSCPYPGAHDVDHGFAELLVAPERNCLPLKESIGYETGCLLFDNWGTPYRATKAAGLSAADDVVVAGCGPIGLAAVALAKLAGAWVAAVDPQPYRLRAAVKLGADLALEAGPDTAKALRDATSGLGPSIVFECSAKAPSYAMAFEALRVGGKLVSIGEGAAIDFHPSDHLIRKRLSIVGSWYTGMADGVAVQELVLAGKIEPSAFVTHRVSLEELPEAMRRVCECTDDVLKTVVLG